MTIVGSPINLITAPLRPEHRAHASTISRAIYALSRGGSRSVEELQKLDSDSLSA